MKSPKRIISEAILREGLSFIEKDPMKNMSKLINWGSKLVITEDHKDFIKWFKEAMENPEGNVRHFTERMFKELTPKIREKFLINFMINANLIGQPLTDKFRKKYHCNIPWAILMDPTTVCNLKCTGCWAQEYNKSSSLSKETLNRIIEEGKKLGIYMYIYSGGEPLVRKDDLISLAEKHNDCMFLAFTNATLVDEDFAAKLKQVGNFLLAISVEGFEAETDMRRGKGTYQKVMKAMDILKKEGLGFGFSTCYHNKNVESVGSEAYIDWMIEKGCMFGWYFTYMPLGKDAVLDLLATPEQRKHMYYQVRKFREKKPIFLLDFWNDGEYVEGCIAGGRKYLHINANGDV